MQQVSSDHPHSRGVAKSDFAFDGLTVYRVFNCQGRLVGHVAVATECDGATLEAQLDVFLERSCPSDGHDPAICPSARQTPAA